MAFRLALKNVLAKPLRAAATIVVIAVAVALLFCMFSFKQAVYEYIFAVETTDAGDSDVLIKSNSTSARISSATGLEGVAGVEKAVPSLSLYSLVNGEYVKLRGFDQATAQELHEIDFVEGSIELYNSNYDKAVISEAAAKHFGLKLGDMITAENGTSKTYFSVAGIAKSTGYFFGGEPYVFVCRTEGVSRLIFGEYAVYNEIYLVTAEGADTASVIAAVSALSKYSSMTVEPAKNSGYIETQANSLTAPVVVSGVGVVLLAVAFVLLIFLMSVADKRKYAAKLAVVGATRKQILSVFVIEALLLAFFGAVIGSAIAGGVFMLLLKITLSSTVSFSVSALKLFGAAAVGAAISVGAAAVPIVLAGRSSARENENEVEKKSKASGLFPIAMLLLTAVSLIVENTVRGAKGALSIVNIILVLASLAICLPYAYRAGGKLLGSVKTPEVKLAAVNIAREKRSSRSLQVLSVGMTVTMLLFMAWSLTTSIFTSYLSDFENMVLVTNVQADISATPDADGISSVEGVKSATPLVWRQATVKVGGEDKTTNILGNSAMLDAIDFEYVSGDAASLKTALEGNGTVVIDRAYAELYGVKVGDKLAFTLDNKTADLTVAGITSHRLFTGNYAVVATETLRNVFGVDVDTVLVLTDGDSTLVAERIRADYAAKNYYAVEALTAYRWDAESLSSVFDLVGTFAIVLTVLVFVVAVAGAVVSRSSAARTHATLLSAGASKNTLLKTELIEYALTALVAYAISFAVSALVTVSLVNALRLFGMYFEFMYRAWVVAAVGGALAVGYSLLPLIMGFKRGYNITRR